MASRGLGFKLPSRWPTQAELRAHAERMTRVKSYLASAPVSLGVPEILDQGNAGACTGFAAVQCHHIASGNPIRSPMFSYWGNRIAGGATEQSLSDSGADPDGVKAALNSFGLAPMIDAPYSDDPAAINSRPPDLAFLTAQAIKADLSPILETGNLLFDACAHVIEVERKPLLIAIQVCPAYDNSTDTNGVADDPSGPSRGLHAICVYATTGSGLLTAGSWGTSFGRAGTVELSTRYVAANVVYAAAFEMVNP